MGKVLVLCAVLASCSPPPGDVPEPDASQIEPERLSTADEASARMEQQIDQDTYGATCGDPFYSSCNPDDPFSVIICGTACFPDQGYCPKYTDWEIRNCLQYCMAWTKDAGRYCDPNTCRPITPKRCVYGLVATPPPE